jgi:hypothetical protein
MIDRILLQKQSTAMEQLKLERDLLEQKIDALLQRHDEELRQIRQDNYILQAQVGLASSLARLLHGRILRFPRSTGNRSVPPTERVN